MARPTNYPPPPARNTTHVGPNSQGVTRQFKPGDGPSQPGIVTNERSVFGAGDAHRAEYAAETAKGQAAMRQRIAELNRSEGDSGSTGRDAANPQGGVGDYLSNDA